MSFGKGGGKGKGDSGNINIRRTRNQLDALSEAALSQFARFGQIGQETPFGTFEFEGEIGSPERRLVQRFTPEVQAAIDRRLATQGQLGAIGQQQVGQLAQRLGQPVSFAGVQPLLSGQDIATSAGQLEQATFDRNLSLLQPQFDRQRTQLVTRLANQGIPQGSQAFDEAVTRLERSQGEQLERLAQSSVAAGRAEQSRLLQSDLARRTQGIRELLQGRQQPLQELQAILTAGQPQQPSFQALPTQGVQQQNLAQLQQQQLGQQQFGKAGKRQTLGDVASLGSVGLLGAGLISDRRVKRDVTELGTVTLYEFNYVTDDPDAPRRRGFMAQEVETVAPDAVFALDGVKRIDYGALVGAR